MGFDLRKYILSSSIHCVNEGSNVYVRCPFHDDNTPSCCIYPDGWKCFGCGAYGDALDFLGKHTGKSIRDILSGDLFSYQVGFYSSPPSERAKKYREIEPGTDERYHKTLELTPSKKSYLLGRGISHDSIADFVLGYGKPFYWNEPMYTIPVYDEKGTLVNVKYRRDDEISDSPHKYKSHAKARPYLFNTQVLFKKRFVVYAGSQIDAILLNQNGIPAVASFSENVFFDEWASLFEDNITFVFLDNDEAGILSTARMCQKIPNSFPVYWPAGYPDKFDINKALLDERLGVAFLKKEISRVARNRGSIQYLQL